ncbi:MAG: hypothetical protein D6768_18885 [Chloroflexi bacterium]|nr:MAG: hypothetical protein D6768_18885 [Chloroflexota bacterium]
MPVQPAGHFVYRKVRSSHFSPAAAHTFSTYVSKFDKSFERFYNSAKLSYNPTTQLISTATTPPNFG